MTLERSLLKRIVEAALFSAGQPVSLEKLAELFYEEERPTHEQFREILAEIEADYAERSVQLKEVASGYRFQAVPEVGEWVARLWEEKPQRYSRALLETLALIAYRQPITRGEVEDIRGVSVSTHIIKTLQEREWVRVLGYRDVPGRPAMYGTTKAFLDYFSLRSLEELPTLAEVRDLDKISAELDERLQQAQPQAALPLETAAVVLSQATVDDIALDLAPQDAPDAAPEAVVAEASEIIPEAAPEPAAQPAKKAAASIFDSEASSQQSEPEPTEIVSPAPEPKQPPKPASLLQNILQRARSIFDDAPVVSSAVDNTSVDNTSVDNSVDNPTESPAENSEESAPTPIDPRDPRLQ